MGAAGTYRGDQLLPEGGETMPYELKLATRTRGLAAIVQTSGTLDLHGAPDFDREIDRLLRGSAREIIVDLRQVEFMDSIGLRSLVRAHRLALRGDVPRRVQPRRPLSVTQRDMRISSGNR